MKVICPCCKGKGEIEEKTPVYLSPMQARVYDIVRKCNGIQSRDLVTRLYGDCPDGGPEFAQISMRVTVKRANDRLLAVRQKISGGRTQLYRLTNVV